MNKYFDNMCCDCCENRQATDYTKGEDKRKATKIEKNI